MTLGNNIKVLRKEYNYSQKELADILQVSQTSVAHYERGTRQPTLETLMMMSNLFGKSIDELIGHTYDKNNKLDVITNKHDLINELVKSLVLKDENTFIQTFEKSVYNIYEIHLIIDDILKEVMYRVGNLWEQGIINEADEHFATNVVRKMVNFLSLSVDHQISKKKAISLIVGSEKHTLGLEMINVYLENNGVDTVYLGSNLPIRSIEEVIDEYNPNYIFISITINEYMNNLVSMLEVLDKKYGKKVKIGIGGQGLGNTNIINFDSVEVLKDLNELSHFLQSN